MRTVHSRTAAATLSLVALLVFAAALPAPAHASDDAVVVTAESLENEAGLGSVYEGEQTAARALFEVTAGDAVSVVTGYCIEQHEDFSFGNTFTAVDQAEAGVPAAGVSAWIGANHTSIGEPLDTNEEAAAAQLAIWHHTDGAELSTDTIPSEEIADRAAELADAVDGELPGTTPTYQLDVAAESDGDEVAVSTSLRTADGAGHADEDLTVIVGDDSRTVTTDSDGAAQFVTEDQGADEVRVEFVGSIPPGTVLVPDDGTQKVVTVEPADIAIDAAAEVDRAEVIDEDASSDEGVEDDEVTEEDETPEEDETEVKDDSVSQDSPVGGELPHTGPGLAPMLLALAAAAGGGGAWMLRR